MSQQGYIKLFRALMDKGWSSKPEYVSVWVHLLMMANHKEKDVFIDGESRTINPGQFITSRKKLSEQIGVHESKIQRILSCFENEHQIEQQAKSKYRIISIVNWDKYQGNEQQNEQQMNSKRTADEQQVNTNKNDKNEKNKNNSQFFTETFETVWQQYPERDGSKKKISAKVLAQLKTKEDADNLPLALRNYLEYVRLQRSDGFNKLRYKNRETWFNGWQDWIEWKPPNSGAPEMPKEEREFWERAAEQAEKRIVGCN